MHIFKKFLKTIVIIPVVIILILFSTTEAKKFDKYNKANNIADYFSGILLLNQSNYNESFKHFKRLSGLEKSHSSFPSKYLYSLINSGNFYQAYNYSKKLEKERLSNYQSELIIGLHYFKNNKSDLSNKYFLKAKNRNSLSILDSYIANTLYIWSKVRKTGYEKSKISLDKLDNRFENLKKIQNVFLSCFFSKADTEELYKELFSNQKTDFSRYYYFYSKYLASTGDNKNALKVVKDSLKKYPRNLILKQYELDLKDSVSNFEFDCKNEKDIIAELLYLAANALSSQSIYLISNFYLSLSKQLNEDFHAYDTLFADNFIKNSDFLNAKKIYLNLAKYGDAFKWHSNKQISRILVQENKKVQSLSLLKKTYKELTIKGIYETYDYAEFLKNNKEFLDSIKYYTEILNIIDKTHPLFSAVTDGRGVSYEQIDEWDKAEKDLLASLEVSPNQAYVINYLAYSWIEKGIKIEKSLSMLEKANKLKSNDPFIIDSLGWALFKLERFQESKDYLQLAVRLMPADPIVNDHYGDVLWKNGEYIQARYYWKYVLNLESTEVDLRKKIERKLLKGL